uniref:Uncharacterized protein n=1 Tax=Pithovirus LCPAC102 TaxID=2506587 RepID=A0A4D5XF58_9VIRU|nr:MAG: hypothetical protein LCPAC102_01520 [Pithovirus LCPAC102]
MPYDNLVTDGPIPVDSIFEVTDDFIGDNDELPIIGNLPIDGNNIGLLDGEVEKLLSVLVLYTDVEGLVINRGD